MTLRAASKLALLWATVTVAALFERQITTSSQPFENLGWCEPQPPAPPLSSPPSTDSQLVTLGSLPPSSFDRCEPIFKWVELERGRRSVSVRLDVSREGIKEGWAIRVDLQTRSGAAVAVDNLIGALLHSEAGGQLLLLPRMASGLGSLTMDVRRAGGGDAAASISAAPLVTCERAPEMPVQPADAWKRSARADYAWMSKEFNRQYLNSHGIAVHPDFRPDAAKAEKDLYALNGRLWCFYGAVHNATRALGEAIRLDPTNFRTMVLLAKIQIGRGRHVRRSRRSTPPPRSRSATGRCTCCASTASAASAGSPSPRPSRRTASSAARWAPRARRSASSARCRSSAPPAACASSLTTPSTRKRRWRRRRDKRAAVAAAEERAAAARR